MTPLTTTQAATLAGLHLDQGYHAPGQGYCLMEAVALIAGRPHTTYPACVSPELRGFLSPINDVLPDAERQQLKAYIPRLLDTTGDGQGPARICRMADWAVRVLTPLALDAAGLSAEAATLRALPPVTDGPTARAAEHAARDAERAAWFAATCAADGEFAAWFAATCASEFGFAARFATARAADAATVWTASQAADVVWEAWVVAGAAWVVAGGWDALFAADGGAVAAAVWTAVADVAAVKEPIYQALFQFLEELLPARPPAARPAPVA